MKKAGRLRNKYTYGTELYTPHHHHIILITGRETDLQREMLFSKYRHVLLDTMIGDSR